MSAERGPPRAPEKEEAGIAEGFGGILRNSAVLAVARIVERVSDAVITLLIARQLGAGDLGVYAAAMAVYSFIAIGGELGVTTYLVREISKDRSRTASYVVHLSVLAAVVCVGVAAAAFAVLPLVGYGGSLRVAAGLVLLAVLPGVLNTIQAGVFLAYQRVEFETMVAFVVGCLNIAAAASLLATGHGVVSILAAFVVIQYLATIAWYVLIRRYIVALPWSFNRALARRLAHEIRPFAGSSALAALFSRPEILILAAVASREEVGYYAAAIKVVDLAAFVPQVVMMNTFPVLSRAFQAGVGTMQAIQDHAIRLLLIFALPVGAITLVAAPEVVEFLFGADLEPAVVPLQILAFNVTLYSLLSVLWRVLSARDEQGTVLRAQVMTTFARLAMGVALIVPFAATGAAVATVASLALHLMLLVVYVRRDGTRIPVLALGWRPALAATGAGAIAVLTIGSLGLWATLALAVTAYLGLLWVLRGLPEDELRRLRRLVRRGLPSPQRQS